MFHSGSDSWLISVRLKGSRSIVWFALLCVSCAGLSAWINRQQAAAATQSNPQLALRQREEPDLRRAFEPQSFVEMLAASRWATPIFNTIVVTTTADTVAVDGGCSLREAIQAANINAGVNECQAGAGPDIITFALGAGTPTINLASPLPDVTEPLDIQGNTGGSTRVRLNGASAGAGAHGLNFTASTCAVSGMVISNFAGDGLRFDANGEFTVQNCHIGTDATGTIAQGNNIGIFISGSSFLIGTDGDGVNDAAEGNLISGNATCGIVIQDAGSDVGIVAGNFIGTDVTGTSSLPNGDGVFISNGPQDDTIGTSGNSISERNVISGNTGVGVVISGNPGAPLRFVQTSNIIVAGNYIGVNAAGTAALPNGGGGILLDQGVNNTQIGTNADGVADDLEPNVISGNTGAGITIADGASTNNLVAGNFIGTNPSGTAAIANTGAGVVIDDSPDNTIGGAGGKANIISGNGSSGVQINNAGATGNRVLRNLIGVNAAGTAGIANIADGVFVNGASNNNIGVIDQGNTIAFNGQRGVRVEGGTGNSILDNLIFSNTGLGIDLGGDSITPNDAGDADAGANNLQNFPVIASITSAGILTGTLNSTPSASFQIAFFANTTCDSSGNGEGEASLNIISVMADAAGNANFTFSFAPVAGKPFITATATDSSNNTSEFSACKRVNTVPTIAAAGSTQPRGTIANNVQVATLTDPDQPLNTLAVLINGGASATVNGVTINNLIVDAVGVVRASIVTDCIAATNASFTLTVTDNVGESAMATLTITITANTPPVLGVYPNTGPISTASGTTITPSAAPTDNGAVASLTASAPGFTGTFSANPATGVITVTNAGPAGNYTVAVTATDNCGATIATTFTLAVNTSPTITAITNTRQQGSAAINSQIATVSDPDQAANTLTVQINGGAGATINGVTVSNLTINAAGQVFADIIASCTATDASFTLRATDNLGGTAMATLNVTVTANTAPVLSYSTPQNVLVSQALTINPATGPSDNESIASIIVQSAGTYTGTISVNSAGVVSLSNAKPIGSHLIAIQATDNCGLNTSSTFTLNVNCQTITVTPPATNTGTAGTSFSQTFTQAGGIGATSFSTASTLPTGITLSSGGVLSGTPTQTGTFPITVKATDSNGCMGTANYTLTINCPAITLAPANLPNATNGTPYSQTITASGGIASYTFAVTGGALPTGLTQALGGALSGVPSQSGTFNFTVTATDANGCAGSKAYTLIVGCPPFPLTIFSPSSVAAGQNLSYDVRIDSACPDVPLNTTLTTSIPANTTFQSISAPSGWSCTTPAVGGTGTITCNNTSFAPFIASPSRSKSSATFTIVLKVNPGTPVGTTITYTINVTGTAPGVPTVTSSLTSSAGVAAGQADVVLTKSGSVTAVSGNTFNYTFNLTNLGPVTADAVTFSDPLPAGTVFVSNTTPAGFTCTTPAVNTNGTVTCVTPSLASGAAVNFTITARLNSNVACDTTIVNTATANSSTSDPNTTNNTSSVQTTAQTQSDLAVNVTAPATATPDVSTTYVLTVTNNGPASSFNTRLNNALPAAFSAEVITSSAGSCTGIGTNSVNCNLGTLAASATATVTIQAHVPETCQPTTAVDTATVTSGNCLADPVAANNSQSKTTTVLLGNIGAGACVPAQSAISAEKPGSILFTGLALSGATAGGGGDSNQNNTQMNLTNVHPSLGVIVHLFFIDGATCSVADSFLCLTANQTTSFLMSDLDPGTSGYLMMMAVDGPPGFAGGHNTGCPISFNYIIGNARIKLTASPRRDADLASESVAAQFGSPAPACDPSQPFAELHFDGSPTGYNQLPRVLALDSVGSRADGNDTLLFLGRIDGNWATGLQPIGPMFGLLFNDTEGLASFSFNIGSCLFRSSLSNNFPRVSPRFEQFIPAGRTGWLKLWAANEVALVGAALTRNDNAQTSPNAFEGGHNLHILRLLPNAVVTVPVFPPSC